MHVQLFAEYEVRALIVHTPRTTLSNMHFCADDRSLTHSQTLLGRDLCVCLPTFVHTALRWLLRAHNTRTVRAHSVRFYRMIVWISCRLNCACSAVLLKMFHVRFFFNACRVSKKKTAPCSLFSAYCKLLL